MIVKLLTEHHLEFLSLKGGCRSTLVKMSNCWKSHAAAQLYSRVNNKGTDQTVLMGRLVCTYVYPAYMGYEYYVYV